MKLHDEINDYLTGRIDRDPRELLREAREELSAITPPSGDWVMVPAIMTPEMLAAYWAAPDNEDLDKAAWHAFYAAVSAAPAPPVGGVTEEMRSAVRWAPSSAYWSAKLVEFFGPSARDGINALEQQLRDTLSAPAARPSGEVTGWHPPSVIPGPADNTGFTSGLALFIATPIDDGPTVRQGGYDHCLRRYVDSTTGQGITPDAWSKPSLLAALRPEGVEK
jgi:hypothetical protein